MSDLERDPLVSKFEQLEQQQQVLAKYIAKTKRQLDELSAQFNKRPELEQLVELKHLLAQLHPPLDDGSASPEVPVEVVSETTEKNPAQQKSQPNPLVIINRRRRRRLSATHYQQESQQHPQQLQSSEYQLVFDRSGSRIVLLEALEQAQERLIIVSPWLNRNSIDADLMQKFKDCLNRNCRIEIGWGHLSDRNRIGIGWRYNALPALRQMERDYPGLFRLKLLGTHEKFLVCDSAFAMLGSHNMLTSSIQSAEREVGIWTTDPYIVQGLIDRFEKAQVVDTQITVDSLTAAPVSLDDGEVLELQEQGLQKNAFLVSPDTESTAQNLDRTSKTAQAADLNAEELSKRYKVGERDFTGINLIYGNLYTENLSGANLSGANFSGISLIRANLTGSDLTGAELSAAILDGANLAGANLSSAVLIQARMPGANLSAANLGDTNLTAAYLVSANLMKANLRGTNLSAANLSQSNLRNAGFNQKTKLCGADLSSVNLAGQDLQKLNLSGVNLTKAILCGAWLCFSNLSGANLTSADLRGADLGSTNLEKANLNGANLTGADLEGAKLTGAIMPDGTVHD